MDVAAREAVEVAEGVDAAVDGECEEGIAFWNQ